MDIKIKASEIEHTAAIDGYIEKKIGRLEKFMKNVRGPHVAQIEIGKNSAHHKNGPVMTCHVHLSIPGASLNSERDAIDLYAAIDLASDDIERQIVKYKETRRGIK
jgi:putative sigma-54 modulation protein